MIDLDDEPEIDLSELEVSEPEIDLTQVEGDTYDASSIKILDAKEIAEVSFVAVDEVVQRYGKPREVVERAYEACQLSGWGFDKYIDKYCENIHNIDTPQEFQIVYAELVEAAS